MGLYNLASSYSFFPLANKLDFPSQSLLFQDLIKVELIFKLIYNINLTEYFKSYETSLNNYYKLFKNTKISKILSSRYFPRSLQTNYKVMFSCLLVSVLQYMPYPTSSRLIHLYSFEQVVDVFKYSYFFALRRRRSMLHNKDQFPVVYVGSIFTFNVRVVVRII